MAMARMHARQLPESVPMKRLLFWSVPLARRQPFQNEASKWLSLALFYLSKRQRFLPILVPRLIH